MLTAWINTRKIWFALYKGSVAVTDANGDYTGEYIASYTTPVMFRANLSPARGTSEKDIFGANLSYSHTLSTTKMNLGIDEQTILWDTEPETDINGIPDPETAKYRVAAIARGHYHIHYALRRMNIDEV